MVPGFGNFHETRDRTHKEVVMKFLMIIGVLAINLLGVTGDVGSPPISRLYETSVVSRDTIEIIIGTPVAGNVIPFWGYEYDACRFQVLFLQTEINTQGNIIQFSFMPTTNAVGTYNNVRVYFCHTSVSQLSTTYDDNYSGNTPVKVIDEPTMQVGGTANQWMDWDRQSPRRNKMERRQQHQYSALPDQ
ncbi:MAG TPA: hypothetical protein EYP24_00275 [bacterium (Candidatus Stahlbacteria)]|nr:hypothetical protein [Candidatus Stahlbacteria bacterium]